MVYKGGAKWEGQRVSGGRKREERHLRGRGGRLQQHLQRREQTHVHVFYRHRLLLFWAYASCWYQEKCTFKEGARNKNLKPDRLSVARNVNSVVAPIVWGHAWRRFWAKVLSRARCGSMYNHFSGYTPLNVFLHVLRRSAQQWTWRLSFHASSYHNANFGTNFLPISCTA